MDCGVTNCGGEGVARGLCMRHYKQLKRGHDPYKDTAVVPQCAYSWCTRPIRFSNPRHSNPLCNRCISHEYHHPYYTWQQWEDVRQRGCLSCGRVRKQMQPTYFDGDESQLRGFVCQACRHKHKRLKDEKRQKRLLARLKCV